MDDDLVLLLAVIGTGVALAALIMSQLSGLKHEMREDLAGFKHEMREDLAGLKREMRSELAELRRELNSLGNRVARLEGVIDMVRLGMQLPKPPGEIEKADAS